MVSVDLVFGGNMSFSSWVNSEWSAYIEDDGILILYHVDFLTTEIEVDPLEEEEIPEILEGICDTFQKTKNHNLSQKATKELSEILISFAKLTSSTS